MRVLQILPFNLANGKGFWVWSLQIVSLTQQLSFCQAINAKAEQPFALEFSGVGGRLEKSFNLRMGNYREWPGAEINDMPYIEAYSQRTQDLVGDLQNLNFDWNLSPFHDFTLNDFPSKLGTQAQTYFA